MKRVSSDSICYLIPLAAALAISSGQCVARCGPTDYFFDGHTRYMWARTWHGPDALATPLNQYFIPRTPGTCNSRGYIGCIGCQSCVQSGITGQYGAQPYPAEAAAGFEPVQFERLGRAPNEMDIGGNTALPSARDAAPTPRR
jgi:hypothetical protein